MASIERTYSQSLTASSGIPLRLQDILAKDLEGDFRFYLDRTKDVIQPLLTQVIVAKAYNCALLLLKKKDIGFIDFRDSTGLTALHHACANASVNEPLSLEIIEKLLERGASPYAKNQEGFCPLHVCLYNQNAEALQRLVYSCINRREMLKEEHKFHFENGKKTLLHEAAAGSNHCLGFILELTDNLKVKDSEGKTALHYAVHSKEPVKNCATLCQREEGIIDIVDQNCETPLGSACKHGKDDVASTLSSFGADPNIGLIPPILNAYINELRDVFLLLLVKGADPNTKWGKNSLLEVAYARRDKQTVDLLILRGAELTAAYRAMVSVREQKQAILTGGYLPNRVGNFTAQQLEAKEHIRSLHELVVSPDTDFSLLLKHTKGKEWEVTNGKGMTPFLYCCRYGSIQNIACLLCSEAQFHAVDSDGNGALHLALQSEFPAVFYFLVAELKVLINRQNRTGQTALHLATQSCHQVAVEILLQFGADTTLRDNDKNSLFHLIASQQESTFKKFEPILDALSTQKGADINGVNSDGDTALFLAWKKANRLALYKLLALGANPDLLDKEGYTLLARVCKAGDEKTAEHLVVSGADRNCKASQTALMTACETGNRSIVQLLMNKRVAVSKGKEKIAHPNRGNDMRTPLCITIDALHQQMHAHPESVVSTLPHFLILQDLLQAGANVNKSIKRNHQKITPLGIAIDKKLPDVVQKLLESKAKVNKGDPIPIERACKAKSPEIVKLLLQHHAKVPKSLKTNKTFIEATKTAKEATYDFVEDSDFANQSGDDSSCQASTYNSKQSSPGSTLKRHEALVSAEEIILRLELLNKGIYKES